MTELTDYQREALDRLRPRQITCHGRDQDTGDQCDRVYRGSEEQARAAGWRIGQYHGHPDAMCPACARPDPDLLRLLRGLQSGNKTSARGARRGRSTAP